MRDGPLGRRPAPVGRAVLDGRIDTAIADLLEGERRARYMEVLAVGAALVDVTIEGPPGRR